LHQNILNAFESLDVARVRRFARKTREYMRGYAKHHMLFGFKEADKIVGFFAIQKFVKFCKSHRCTLDQDYAFVGQA
jgi:hypothetical protein